MKKLLPLCSIAIICLSCSQQADESQQDEFEFSYSLDTVVVDPGEGFINLKRGLNAAALSPDKKQLFNYNAEGSEMEVIDLESLKLSDRIKMEKEGPQGTGDPRSMM